MAAANVPVGGCCSPKLPLITPAPQRGRRGWGQAVRPVRPTPPRVLCLLGFQFSRQPFDFLQSKPYRPGYLLVSNNMQGK